MNPGQPLLAVFRLTVPPDGGQKDCCRSVNLFCPIRLNAPISIRTSTGLEETRLFHVQIARLAEFALNERDLVHLVVLNGSMAEIAFFAEQFAVVCRDRDPSVVRDDIE